MNPSGVRPDPAFRILERREAFRGKVVGVTVDHMVLPGGHETRHEVLHLPSAVCVVPLLEEGGRTEVVLVEQFRNALEGWIHEVPAGILEPGKNPAECAARELEEETGYTAARITHLATLFPIPGTSAHLMHFYLAEGLTPGVQKLEPAECLTVRRVPLEALIDRVLGGGGDPGGGPAGRGPGARPGGVEVVDAKTHIAILRLALLRRAAGEASP